MTKVIIDPRFRLEFGSHYINGMEKVFGKNSLHFKMKPFLELVEKDDPEAFDHYMAMVVKQDHTTTRLVIDFRDKLTINKRAWEWCDLYGKMNLNSGKTEKKYLEKAVSIGPMVAPRIWSLVKTAWRLPLNYLRCWKHITVGPRYYASGYKTQYRRPELNDFKPEPSEDHYIFFDSSLWTESGSKSTNHWRASFIRTCKSMDVEFEGGLFAYRQHPEIEKFRDVLLEKMVSLGEYISQIKRSALVFNTPSLHGGHGWKLGEFLAMGKAIVSTPLLNDMPVPLEHGKNIHFIKSEEEIRGAIEMILGDPVYRRKLEKGASEYYLTYLEPEVLIRRLLSICSK